MSHMYTNQWNNSKYIYPFANCLSIQETFSLTWQDIFIISVLQGKKNGTYLEIGAHWPDNGNNTYLMSKHLNWSGVSIDFEHQYEIYWKNLRPNNKFLCADALNIDYDSLIQENYKSTTIDYLQLDIEPNHNTLAALKRIPLEKYRFAVITFETDLYTGENGIRVREESRSLLKNYGYELIIGDVLHHGSPYEDWYVDLNLVNKLVALDIKRNAEISQNPCELLLR